MASISDILTGRVYHWTTTHNLLLRELFERAGSLDDPFDKFFKAMVIGASVVIEEIVKPKDAFVTKTLKFNVDLKRISKNEFSKFYSILLSQFVYLYATSNPSLTQQVISNLHHVSSDPDLCDQILRKAMAPNRDLYTNNMAVWGWIRQFVGIGDSDPAQLIYFTTLMLDTYGQGMRGIIANQ